MNPNLLLIPGFSYSDFTRPWCMKQEEFTSFWKDIRSGLVDLSDATPKSTAVVMQAGRGKNIAVLNVRNTMIKPATWWGTSTVQLRNDLRAASVNPDISGILLSIDSPGGSSAGMPELVMDVNKAREKKPVWAHIEDMGASAAYYLASQADALFASPGSVVGSIGTMLAVPDLSKLAEREGVFVHMFKTGDLKGAGYPGTPVTEEQQTEFQSWVDGVQELFDSAVRKGRYLSAAELSAVRTGGIFMPPVAQNLKLIDGIQSFDKTLARLAAAA